MAQVRSSHGISKFNTHFSKMEEKGVQVKLPFFMLHLLWSFSNFTQTILTISAISRIYNITYICDICHRIFKSTIRYGLCSTSYLEVLAIQKKTIFSCTLLSTFKRSSYSNISWAILLGNDNANCPWQGKSVNIEHFDDGFHKLPPLKM